MRDSNIEWVSNKIKIDYNKISEFINKQKSNKYYDQVAIFSYEDKYELLFLISISIKFNNRLKIKELTPYLGSYLFYCKTTDTYDVEFDLDLGIKIEKKINKLKFESNDHVYNLEQFKYTNYMFNFLCRGYKVEHSKSTHEFAGFNSWDIDKLNKKLKTFVNYFTSNSFYGYHYHYKSLNYIYKSTKKDTGIEKQLNSKNITKTNRANKLALRNTDSVRSKNETKNIKNFELFKYYSKWSNEYKPDTYEIDHIFPRKAFIDNDLDIKYNNIIIRWICNCSENLQFISKMENGIKSGSYNQDEFIQWFNNMLQNILK